MRVALLLGALAMAGCSSTQYNYQSQYCYTDERIVQNGNTIDKSTVLECTDRPSRQTEIQRAGIDPACREFWYPEIRYGKRVMSRGVVCEKYDGTSEIINIDGNVR